jgi:hypothetical protein
MPPQINDWATGAAVTTFTITGQAADASGNLTDSGGAVDVRAVLDEFGHETGDEFEEIRPIWSVQQNDVWISGGNRLTITTLNRTGSAAALSNIKATYPYFKASWIEGKEQFVGYFRTGEFTGGMRGHGRQTKTLVGRPCDPNQPQVVRTVLP